MKLGRSRRLTVNFGDYEGYQFGADVGLTHHDIGYSDEEWTALTDEERTAATERLRKLVLDELHTQLHDEIEDSAMLTRQRKSFVHKLVESPAKIEDRPVRRRRKRAHGQAYS